MVSSLFDRWWSNFIQWCIIIVPLLFSLWLAGWFMEIPCDVPDTRVPGEVENFNKGENSVGEESQGISGDEVLCEAAVQAFALGALVVGIIMSMQFSAAGSKMIIGKSKDYYKRSVAGSAGWAKKQAYTRGRWPVPAGARRGIADSKVGELGRKATRFPGVKRLVAPVMRRGTAKREEYLSEWKKNKDYDTFSPTALRQALNYERDSGRRAKILDLLADKHPSELNKHVDGLNSDERDKLEGEIKARGITHPGSEKNVLELRPDIAKNIGKDIGEAIAKATDASISNWSRTILEDPEIVKELVENNKFNKSLLSDIGRDADKMLALEVGVKSAFGSGASGIKALEHQMKNYSQQSRQFIHNIRSMPHAAALFSAAPGKKKKP